VRVTVGPGEGDQLMLAEGFGDSAAATGLVGGIGLGFSSHTAAAITATQAATSAAIAVLLMSLAGLRYDADEGAATCALVHAVLLDRACHLKGQHVAGGVVGDRRPPDAEPGSAG
jgi:hypothetical protein